MAALLGVGPKRTFSASAPLCREVLARDAVDDGGGAAGTRILNGDGKPDEPWGGSAIAPTIF